MKEYSKYFVEVDWKSESEDILYSIRAMYSSLYTDVNDSVFEELAENYCNEQTEDFINALGQELSSKKLLLYEIDKDSDSYVLAIITIEEENSIENYLRNNKMKAKIRKQQRKKIGDKAKRIEVRERINCEKFEIIDNYKIKDDISGLNKYLILQRICFNPKKIDSAILDITNWYPKQSAELNIIVNQIINCEEKGMLAHVLDCAWDEKGFFKYRKNKIIYGQDINNINEWNYLNSDLKIDIKRMIYFNDCLFMADKNAVYIVKDIYNFKNSTKKIFETEEGDTRWYPQFFICNNNLYLYMQQSIYILENHQGIFKSTYKFKKIYTINGFDVNSIEVVKDNIIAFQVREEYLTSKSVGSSELITLDLASMKEIKYPCEYGEIFKWDNKICIKPSDIKKDVPMLICFDFDLNQKRVIEYGALGKEKIKKIYETSSGTIIEDEKSCLYRVENLWEFMKMTE